jgi:hypothetical protein
MQHLVRRLSLLVSVVGALSACGGNSSSGPNWVGKTYLLDYVPAANWTKPKGVGSDVGAYVPQFLIGVAAGTGSDLAITLTTAMDGSQDMCNPTTQVTVSGANYPSSEISVPSLPIHVVDTDSAHPASVHSTAHDFLLKDVLPADSAAKVGELDATVDLGELYKLFYLVPNATPDAVCQTLNQAGVPCDVCAFNQQPYCLTLQASQIVASKSAATITPLADSVIASDPSCQ